MNPKTLAAFTTVFILTLLTDTLSAGPVISTRAAIRVPIDYATIQEAINAAKNGDTIHVLPGVYYENLMVNKQVQLIGENQNTTIINGNGTAIAVKIAANNVSLSGFTILNATYGVNIGGTSNNAVQGNIFMSNSAGIRISGGQNNTIKSNAVTENTAGIALYTSVGNTILSNKVWNNSWHGISLWYSSQNNLLLGNQVWNNMNGILLYSGCDNNEILSNDIQNNTVQGIYFASSSSNIVEDNRVSNHEVGVRIRDSDENLLNRNIITKSKEQGLIAENSKNNTIHQNIFFNNAVGLSLFISDNNTVFHNNFILNQRQAEQNWSMNIWDYEAEGNYWDDYRGIDIDKDGVGDTDIPHLGLDRFPLMAPYILGDINHDLVVETKDLVILANSFGATTSGRDWNPHADSNGDRFIDIYDLIIIGLNFGKKWQFEGEQFGAHLGAGKLYQQ